MAALINHYSVIRSFFCLGLNFAVSLQPNLGIIFEPKFILPLLGLAALSLIPVFYKKKSKQGTEKMKDKYLFCDLAIIGGGSAGLRIAAGCSQLGLQVVLVEPNKMGGDCLNYGCVLSKTLLNTAKILDIVIPSMELLLV